MQEVIDVKRETLCVAYTGAAVDSGAMSVNDLAPALLALSNLIGEANRALNNDDSKVEVRLNAHFERGSFEMSFELIQSLSNQIKLLFSDSYSIEDILNHIGLFCTISGFTGISLFQLIRWVRNRKIEKIEETDKKTIKIVIEEEIKEVSAATWILFRSHKVKQHLEGILHPLTKEGVDGFEVRDKDNKKTLERIESTEVEIFNAPAEELNSTRIAVIKIVKLSFDRTLKWRFSTGESDFSAVITDKDFLDKVERGEIAFRIGDALKAELHTKQQIFSDSIKETITVTKVLEILEPEQRQAG